MAVLAAVCTAVVAVAFDWSFNRVSAGLAVGIVLWGTVKYLTETHNQVPDEDALPLAPPDAAIVRRRRPTRRLFVVCVLIVPFAWVAGELDVGAFILPGMFAGDVVANL